MTTIIQAGRAAPPTPPSLPRHLPQTPPATKTERPRPAARRRHVAHGDVCHGPRKHPAIPIHQPPKAKDPADDRLDLLALDCPPGFSDILKQAIAVADLVIVPTGPSDLDLTAVISTVFMAREAGVLYRFVLNGVLSRSRLAREAMPALRDWGDLLCPPIHQRVAIATAMAWGSTAQEIEPNGAAARALAALWPAVREALKAYLAACTPPPGREEVRMTSGKRLGGPLVS